MDTTNLAAQALAADDKPTSAALHLCSRMQGRIDALAHAIGTQDRTKEAEALRQLDELRLELIALRVRRAA